MLISTFSLKRNLWNPLDKPETYVLLFTYHSYMYYEFWSAYHERFCCYETMSPLIAFVTVIRTLYPAKNTEYPRLIIRMTP